MLGKRAGAMLAFAILTVLSVAPASAATDRDRDPERGGSIVACSLDGINPAAHPEVFGNPAEARRLGFVLGPDHAWHVVPNCRAGR